MKNDDEDKEFFEIVGTSPPPPSVLHDNESFDMVWSPPPRLPSPQKNSSAIISAKLAIAHQAEIARQDAIHMGSTQLLNNMSNLSLNSHVPGPTKSRASEESTNSSLDDLSDVQNLNPNGSSLNMSLLEGEQFVINDYCKYI